MFITETFNSPIPYLFELTFFKSPLKDIFLLIFKRFYSFIFRQRGRKGERKERNISVCLPLEHPRLGTWPSNQAYALTGNQTGNSLVLRPALNELSYTSQNSVVYLNKKVFNYVNIQTVRSGLRAVQ